MTRQRFGEGIFLLNLPNPFSLNSLHSCEMRIVVSRSNCGVIMSAIERSNKCTTAHGVCSSVNLVNFLECGFDVFSLKIVFRTCEGHAHDNILVYIYRKAISQVAGDTLRNSKIRNALYRNNLESAE